MNVVEAIQEGAGVTFVYRLDPVDHQPLSTLLESEVIAVAEWARKEALREAAAFVKSEIERLELVKGTYAKAQRHALGMVWGHIRADVLAEGVSDGQQ